MSSRGKVKILRVAIKAFAHATEDVNKVKDAVKNILPNDIKNLINNLNITKVKGHYGNEISILDLTLSKRDSYSLFKNVLCNLEETERNILLASLSSRSDRKHSHLYLRLSKQDAYLGRLRLLDGSDVIKLIITFSGIKNIDDLKLFLEDIVRQCK